jgi:hypothetical protein
MLKITSKIVFNKWLIPVLAILFFLITEIFSRNPEFVERYYSNGVYPLIAKLLSAFSGIFPFSLDDIYYSLLAFTILGLTTFLILRKIKFKQAILYVLNILASVYILFYLLWGFNYYRLNLPERIELKDSSADKAEFITITEKLIKRTNLLHCTFDNLDKNEVDSLIEESY